MKRFPWFEAILIIVVTTISLYGAFSDGQNFSRRWFTRDDAYYYFKVAQNISEGHGSTFDGINKTNGYHPLWMIVCVPIFALARFDLILPLRILFVLMNGLSLATAILLYRLIGKIFIPAIGAIAALYWVFSTDIMNRVYQQGLETGIAAFFIVLFLNKLYDFERSWREKTLVTKDLIVLGLIGIGVIFSRLDLIFFVGVAGIWVVFRGSPLRYLLPLDIVSVVFSILLAYLLKLPINDYYKIAEEAIKVVAVSLFLKIPLAYFLGLYQRNRFDHPLALLRSLVLFSIVSSSALFVISIVMSKVLTFYNFPRMILIYDAIITFLLIGLTRLIITGLKTDGDEDAENASVFFYLRSYWIRWIHDAICFFGIAFGGAGSVHAVERNYIWNFFPGKWTDQEMVGLAIRTRI